VTPADWYDEVVVASGRAPALWALIGFVVAFAVTRTITRRLHARRAADSAGRRRLLRDAHVGGVHVHHQVWGILLVLLAGLLQFRYAPGSPGVEILAAAFGAGAALALDEFALWFHLEDVYWTEEGRKSIDAILLAGVLAVSLLFQTSPLGLTEADEPSHWAYAGVLAVHLGLSIVCLLKGKLATGIIGVVVPVVSAVGAVRLARPRSFWARRWYGEAAMRRSTERYGAWEARRDRIRDLLGGRPE
jgi:hypothetical protein